MRLLRFLVFSPLAVEAIATPSYKRGHEIGIRQEEEDDSHVYDEACNIGYCSIMGATVGGWGGNYTNVTTLEEFTAAVAGSETSVVIVNGAISGNARVAIGSSKSILGSPGSSLTGISLSLQNSRNVILRNLRLSTPSPIAISVENGRSIWVDHCDLSSPFGGSLLSITHGSDYITVSNNIFHSAIDAAQVGHSDANAAEDRGKLHVTFTGNVFRGVTNGISFRFGTGHVMNSYFANVTTGINTRMGADLLIESSIFEDTRNAIVSVNSTETGFATVQSVLVGEAASSAPEGNMTVDSLPYPYGGYVWDFYSVRENIVKAGQTMKFRPVEVLEP